MVDEEDDPLKKRKRRKSRSEKVTEAVWRRDWWVLYATNKDGTPNQAGIDKLIHFKEWDRANPKIYEKFVERAYGMRRMGKEHYSAYYIFYAIRFDIDIKTVGSEFKINNDHIPMFVRCLIREDESFLGFFKLCPVGNQNKRTFRMPDEDWE